MSEGILTLVADDEALARRKLRRLASGVEWIGEVIEAEDGPSAVSMIDERRPPLVFLDIRMPGASGIEVLERVEHRPHVVFTTAYDRYAVTAFELQALDYLLKPFGTERFEQAMDRVRVEIGRGVRVRDGAAGDPDDDPDSMALAGISNAEVVGRAREALSPGRPLRRLFVRGRGRIVPVSVSDIEHFEARGDYVRIHVADRGHLVNVPLKDFEARLDPERFLRVHRSHMVNLDHVDEIVPCDGSRLEIRLRSGAKVVASRERSKRLRRFVI